MEMLELKDGFGRIASIEPGSPADAAGIRVGDELVSIDGRPVADVLDFVYKSAEDRLKLVVSRDGREKRISVGNPDGDLGIEFTEELFGGVRSCVNRCIFCFLHQMPKGLRRTLYVRDDDFRLSFAHGNYVTLTNLSDEDIERICSQRMSPLYVSVHATEPELRAKMLGKKEAGRIMEQLRRLADARVNVHTQIVLCPGVNDGPHLERTIRDLAGLFPSVASIAVVPVGLTRHREGLTPLRNVDPGLAGETISLVETLQKEFKKGYGTRLVFASDEFYLLAGRGFPSRRAYEGFPQLQDGVGLCRLFLDEMRSLEKSRRDWKIPSKKYILVTGTLAAPLIEGLADAMNRMGADVEVCAVKNEFLGETVTVAGLLAGRDIASVLADAPGDAEVLIPDVAVNEGRFIDDWTVSDLREAARTDIEIVCSGPRGLVKELSIG